MKNQFIQFLEDSTVDNYKTVRAELIAVADYAPYSDELVVAAELLSEQQWERAHQVLSHSMPNLILSPRAHLMLAVIADHLGDEVTRDVESMIAGKICDAIIASGDGTKVSPRLVTRTSDAHDVLCYLQKTCSTQTLHEQGGKSLDCLTCNDGESMWFDVTDLMQYAA